MIKYKITLLVFILLFGFVNHVFPQKTIVIKATANRPVIDGKLDDICWESAAVINEFYQREPKTGEPLTEKTEVFICYDAHYLYFGLKCYQDPGTVIAKEMKFDASYGTDDRLAIMLDTYSDHRRAYFLGINALGGKEDAIVNENSLNKSWNGLWDGRARITDEGWEAEIAMPFKSLGFDKNSKRWGLFMNRFIAKKREWGSWPVGNINSTQFSIAEGGIIEGLEGMTQGVGLDISPYFITGFDSKRGNGPKYKINAGTDVYYQVAPNLKASLSINTDFADVEADSRQINLTRFSLRLNEKRDFFLDGSSYFSFGPPSGYGFGGAPSGKIEPFFSRRIGLDDRGSPIPVHYGAKLTGTLKDWNIGILHVSDDRDYGTSNFSVGRVSHNLGKQSSVGMITTYGNANDSTRNFLGGLDLKLATSTFRGNKNVSLVLFGLKSNNENIRGKDVSWGATFSYPNDLINFRLGYVEIGNNFKAGIGYVPRTNIRESYGSLSIGPRLNKWGIRQVSFGGSFDYVTDFNNKLQSKNLGFNPLGIIFESGETFNYSISHEYDYLEYDFNIYSDYIIPVGEYQWWRNQLSLRTEGSRDVAGSISYGFGNFYTGYNNSIGFSANWKIAVPVYIGGSFSSNKVKLPEGEFVANIIELNANLLFSPNLTLYNFFQFDSQSKVLGWQSRFLWILKPGNEIHLVWNSGFTKPLERYLMNESAMRFKLKYNIRF
jgi:hypothetical protein